MPEFIISGVTVEFPFEPYQVQTDYMAKVIECLEEGVNGMLESPTGTGKTLSLLCSSLGWLSIQKAKFHANLVQMSKIKAEHGPNSDPDPFDDFAPSAGAAAGANKNWGCPKIIYASRTHSQLTQAMQELKRTKYHFMKAAVLGSRDQMCINPDVQAETGNAAKTHLCRLKVLTRSCGFHSRVEKVKDSRDVQEAGIMDIEDLVKVGTKQRCCPYFLSRELIEQADIIFMPYNYLLDPKARRANKIELTNTIVILDEAHNVEKMCEESASIQIRSTDIALSIEDLTGIMKHMEKGQGFSMSSDEAKDFTMDDLATLKEVFLSLERAVDEIQIKGTGGSTFEGGYIFELLNKANITHASALPISALLDKLIQFLTTVNENNAFGRKGANLQTIADLLTIVFVSSKGNEGEGEYMLRIQKCFKVHIDYEDVSKQPKKVGYKRDDGWIAPKSIQPSVAKNAKVINYWCFNPGFAMISLMEKNVRSIILTSGTLAPLKPLISELGIPITKFLENPHIIDGSQVYVRILSNGPDKQLLMSNYENRNNTDYLTSMGRTILSLCNVIPAGLLVFFPSYPMMNTSVEHWQQCGIWSQIVRSKQIFVEPRTKDAFSTAMTEYYQHINDPASKGAIFMAVCRGKVSEGLDFADANGRAVIITGLPFPPLKDPRVLLKQRYLDENRSKNRDEILSGKDWYVLEATRAVNQAIGRVIRHKNDYGAILFCDSRFHNPQQKNQLSKWIHKHLKAAPTQNFGQIVGELARFFKNAERTLPQPKLKPMSYEERSEDAAPTTVSTKTAIKIKVESTQDDFDISSSYGTVKMYKGQPIRKANEIMCFDPPEAAKYIKKEPPASQDLFSRLDTDVAPIDFNDVSSYNNYSSASSNLVTIHKRSPPSHASPFFSDAENRRKRFKLVPNSITQAPVVKIEPPSQPVEPKVPEDRAELIRLLKSQINRELYMLFLSTLKGYQQTQNLDELIVNLIKCFSTRRLNYILRGMRRFVKRHHHEQFDKRVAEYEPVD